MRRSQRKLNKVMSRIELFMPLLICAIAGCGADVDSAPASVAEKSFAEQVREVRQGRSQEIRISKDKLADGDLIHLAELPELSRLLLESSDITDAGLATLAKMPKLQTLRLSCPRVTDEGLRMIAGSRSLRALILLDAPVTDAGALHLGEMKQLESLYLTRTRVTEAGIAALKERLPQLHVHW